jgi:hypothetical protein
VITLDTNLLGYGSLTSPEILRLHGVAARHRIPLVVTETVLAELTASLQRKVTQLNCVMLNQERPAAKRAEARKELLGRVPLWNRRPMFARGDDTAVPSLQQAVDLYRARVNQIFQGPLAMPAGASADGTSRELALRPPAMPSGNGGRGARDTEIWVTFLHHAPRQAGVSYFLSKDGGFGAANHEALTAEALEKGVEVRLLASIDALIDHLSSPAESPYTVDELAALPEVRAAVTQYLLAAAIRLAIIDWVPGSGSVNETSDNTIEPVAGRGKAAACRVGPVTIIGFEQIWRIRYPYRLGTYDGDELSFAFTMKIGLVIHVEGSQVRALPVNNAGVWEEQLSGQNYPDGDAVEDLALSSPSS